MASVNTLNWPSAHRFVSENLQENYSTFIAAAIAMSTATGGAC